MYFFENCLKNDVLLNKQNYSSKCEPAVSKYLFKFVDNKPVASLNSSISENYDTVLNIIKHDYYFTLKLACVDLLHMYIYL